MVLLMVARIGIYKYVTANRNLGYELHLYQTRHIPANSPVEWQADMLEVGWEEAMRAWRIVQTTVYQDIYKKGWLRAGIMKKKHRRTKWWFKPNMLSDNGTVYYPGSYLQIVNKLLIIIAVGLTIPMFVVAGQLYFQNNGWYLLYGGIALLSLAAIITFSLNYSRRRKILEEGLLSIPSCAIMWHAVVVAHFRALRKLREKPDCFDFNNYIEYLWMEAKSLTGNIEHISKWISKDVSTNS
jgi:hypothetical protein